MPRRKQAQKATNRERNEREKRERRERERDDKRKAKRRDLPYTAYISIHASKAVVSARPGKKQRIRSLFLLSFEDRDRSIPTLPPWEAISISVVKESLLLPLLLPLPSLRPYWRPMLTSILTNALGRWKGNEDLVRRG